MAIDRELPAKNRRIMRGGGSPEPEEEAAAAEEEEQAVSAHGEWWPPWLRRLLSARFYTRCEAHADWRRDGERTMFCLDCAGAGALCALCLADGHRGHRAIQIRRSTYSSVIRVSDLRGLVDVGGVQTYVINGARVVFLNKRGPQHKHGRGVVKGGGSSLCEPCGRGLIDVFSFCSLGCKVAGCSPDSNTSSSPLRDAVTQSSTLPPPPPPPRTLPAKRRKGIPRRAPFGSLIVDY